MNVVSNSNFELSMNDSEVQELFSPVGSQWGLSLLINVEQYENIKGLNTDAGIKVSEFIQCIYQKKFRC